MTRGRPFRLLAFTVLLLAGTFGRARAADALDASAVARTTEEIGLDYAAPDNCPGVEAYLTDLEQRLGPTWKVALKELARHLSVMIARSGDRYDGAVEFATV